MTPLTYCGLGDPSHRHRKAKQGVVLIVRQTQKFGNVLESLGWSQPVQTGQSLTKRQGSCNHKSISVTLCTNHWAQLYWWNRFWWKSAPGATVRWWRGWLTLEICATAPPGGGCVVLQVACCGGGAGRCSQHELCTGQSFLPPAGPDNTSYGAPCIRTERLLNVRCGLLQGISLTAYWQTVGTFCHIL